MPEENQEKDGRLGGMKPIMNEPTTKEGLFAYEKEKQEFFNKFYREKDWPYKRIFGKENKKYDCVVLIDGKWIKVEEKHRIKIWSDMAVELVQDTETNDPGWLYYTEADWILYGMGERIYLIEVRKLREFVEIYKDKFNIKISKKGWGKTENLIIEWSVIIQNKIGRVIK